MRIAIVGCGYVADYYIATLPNHPLELAGVFDRDPGRAERFATHHRLRRYFSLDEVLGDPSVELVVNLTNPRSHFEVSSAALEMGKHVYTEKPLATSLPEAERLVEMAESRGLLIGSAPCTVLGETAQTIWKALREKRIGTPRVAYAEMDDGPIPLEDYASWTSASGAPWPAQGRVRGRVHAGARRLLPHLADRVLRTGDDRHLLRQRAPAGQGNTSGRAHAGLHGGRDPVRIGNGGAIDVRNLRGARPQAQESSGTQACFPRPTAGISGRRCSGAADRTSI